MTSVMQDRSVKYYEAYPLQKIAAICSILLSFVALALTIHWMNSDANPSYMGGLNFSDHLFNYHPVFMITGLHILYLS